MTTEEIKVINEIKEYQEQIAKTNSLQRKQQLQRHIYKLQKQLDIYNKIKKYKTC